MARHHQPGDDSDLAEARQLVEKLRPFQGDRDAGRCVLEAQIDKAAGQLDAATARFREFAGRPGLTATDRLHLGEAAERLGLLDAAETVYRRVAAEPPADPNQFMLVGFLARHARLKDAVDLCETLWADAGLREKVAAACVGILSDPATPPDPVQLKRVIGWIERARLEKPQSMMYLLGLGNLNERLGDYRKAEEMYRTAINTNDREGIASNNLAWLIVLLKRERGNDALDLINKAIRDKGEIPEYLDTRGMIYLHVGEKQCAISDLERALKAAPSPPKYFHLAQAYLQPNENEKARKALEARQDPRDCPSASIPWRLGRHVTSRSADKLGMRLEGPRPGPPSRFRGDLLEVGPVVVGDAIGQPQHLLGRDEPHAEGDLLDAGDLQPLAGLDGLDVVGRLDQATRSCRCPARRTRGRRSRPGAGRGPGRRGSRR